MRGSRFVGAAPWARPLVLALLAACGGCGPHAAAFQMAPKLSGHTASLVPRICARRASPWQGCGVRGMSAAESQPPGGQEDSAGMSRQEESYWSWASFQGRGPNQTRLPTAMGVASMASLASLRTQQRADEAVPGLGSTREDPPLPRAANVSRTTGAEAEMGWLQRQGIWVQGVAAEAQAAPGAGGSPDEDGEVERLRREVEVLRLALLRERSKTSRLVERERERGAAADSVKSPKSSDDGGPYLCVCMCARASVLVCVCVCLCVGVCRCV